MPSMTPEALAVSSNLPPQRRRVTACVGLCALLALAFAGELARLAAHALEHELHSHIVLVPLIAGYFLYTRPTAGQTVYRTSPVGAGLMALVAAAALGARVLWRDTLSVNDDLALMASGFVSLVAAIGFLCLGAQWMAAAAFPVILLVFMVPMPDGMAKALEAGLVRGSADASEWLFRLTATPLVRDGTTFSLPGITLHIADECSGIRSSWVLFITSLIAAHSLLEAGWRRALVVMFVIPLGIVRNAFRILVIGLLCVHIGPHMSDSYIHRSGGPIFFALSLVPLFALLWWLRPRGAQAAASR